MMEVVAALPANPLLIILFAVYGLIIGSFLNVVIVRLPIQLEAQWQRESHDHLQLDTHHLDNQTPLTIVSPRSHCPQCQTTLTFGQNIPIVSFILLRGRCGHCEAPISLQYPSIELLTASVTVIALLHFGMSLTLVYALLFSYALILLLAIDYRHQLLPDYITIPLLWMGLLVNLQGHFSPLESAVLGAATGYASLWAVFWLFKLVTGREGMGYGDFKFLAALGAWLGWQMLPLVVVVASVSALFVSIIAILLGLTTRSQPIAFGPFLAGAGYAIFYWSTSQI